MRHLEAIDTWIFDLDNTLYPASCRLFDQVDRRMGSFIEAALGLGPEEARGLQKRYFREHGTTLRGLMDRHRIAPADYLDYVHDIDLSPVPPNPALAEALAALPGRRIVFTNASVRHAENVMARLGIAHLFEAVFDIVASDFRPKPEPRTYDRLVETHGIAPDRAVLFEDIPRNLVPAAALGMRTVLVRDPEHTPAWAAPDAETAAAIDHVIEDLADWLTGVMPKGAAGESAP